MGQSELCMDEVVTAARDAARAILRRADPERMEARPKGPGDIVTAADFEAERLIVERLRQLFPDDAIIGEEGSQAGPGGPRAWHVDPLDGTVNFSRGIPLWCVSIGMFDKGRPLAGVIYDPRADEMFVSSGGGLALDGEPHTPPRMRDISEACVHLTVDFKDQNNDMGLRDLIALQPYILRTRNFGSVALALAYVASGRLDAVVHRAAHSWDFAAGSALVLAAGGTVSDVEGRPFTDQSTSILAATGDRLHAQVLDVIRANSVPSLK